MQPRLDRTIFKKVSDPLSIKEKDKYIEEMTSERYKGIKEWYKKGGLLFKNWVKEYYHRWTGEKLKWDDPHLAELFEFFGNPWIQSIVISKSAQCGFTELCISFSAFCLAYPRISVCFGVEQSQKLRDIIAPRVQPSFDNCNPIVKIKDKKKRATGRLDTDSKDRIITVGGVPITFFWMSRASANDGRKATSSVSSFEGWVAIADEIELMPIGALDIIRQRQNSCTMPSKPFRAGSTPGSIGGIVDTEVKKSGHSFEWSVKCPHCKKDQFLNGFGNLLKKVTIEENDELKERYLDELGKPLNWFHKAKEYKSKSAKINSTYIGCQFCNKELTKETINKGQFICKRSLKTLKEISDYYLKNQKVLTSTCSIQIPRLALNNFSPSGMIDQLLNSRDPADTIQQGLGIAVSIGSGKIELDIILESQKEPPQELGEPELVIIGFDQGRVNNYAVIQNWWFPEKYRDAQKTWQEGIKQNIKYEIIPWGFPPSFKYLDQLVSQYNANWICLDSDPESNLALNYARERLPNPKNLNQVILCDQVKLTGKKFARRNQNSKTKKTKRKSGDQPILKKIPFYSIDRTFGLDAVRDRFYKGKCYLPDIEYDQNDDDNPILHYRTSERGSDNLWREPQAAPDHFFHADNFGEMAALISFYEKRGSKLTFSTLD